ncbi:MAG: hypothetical protein PVF91_03615 [Chromatiales bacterium]
MTTPEQSRSVSAQDPCTHCWSFTLEVHPEGRILAASGPDGDRSGADPRAGQQLAALLGEDAARALLDGLGGTGADGAVLVEAVPGGAGAGRLYLARALGTAQGDRALRLSLTALPDGVGMCRGVDLDRALLCGGNSVTKVFIHAIRQPLMVASNYATAGLNLLSGEPDGWRDEVETLLRELEGQTRVMGEMLKVLDSALPNTPSGRDDCELDRVVDLAEPALEELCSSFALDYRRSCSGAPVRASVSPAIFGYTIVQLARLLADETAAAGLRGGELSLEVRPDAGAGEVRLVVSAGYGEPGAAVAGHPLPAPASADRGLMARLVAAQDAAVDYDPRSGAGVGLSLWVPAAQGGER